MNGHQQIWLSLLPLALACGHLGLEDLEQEQQGGAPVIDDGSGGKDLGDGDLGDGDLGDGDLGDGDLGDGDASSGGATNGLGGAGAGNGGADVGSGGADVGSGGADVGAGGGDTNTGGSEMGAGGSDRGAGGSDSGTGGVWEPDAEIWADPDRTGCAPLCPVVNPSFSSHYLFEQTTVPLPPFTSNGELSISTEYANWGLSSLKASVGGSPAYAHLSTSIVTTAQSAVFVRAWVYVPSGVVTGDLGLLDFLSGDTPAALIKTHPEARLSAEAPLVSRRAMSKVGTYPLDEWFCLRAAVISDDTLGSVTVEASDVVVAELTDTDTRDLVDVDTVNFGVTSTGPHQGPGEIYWDSLVIDQQPVACDDLSVPL